MKRKEALLLAIVALLVIGGLTACAWLAQPLEQDPAPHHASVPDVPVVPAAHADTPAPKTNIDVGSGVSVSVPAPTPGPITIPIGEGAAVTINAPAPSHTPTNGDAVAQAVGGLAQLYGAGPTGGVLVAYALSELFGALTKRKPTPTV